MSSLWQKFKKALRSDEADIPQSTGAHEGAVQELHEALIKQITDDVLIAPDVWVSRVKLSESATWEDLKKNGTATELMEFAIYCITVSRNRKRQLPYSQNVVLEAICSQILRRKLPFSEADVSALFDVVLMTGSTYSGYGNPLVPAIGVAERSLDGRAAEGGLKIKIEKTLHRFDAKDRNYALTQDEFKLKTRLESLLEPTDPSVPNPLPKGAWLTAAQADLVGRTEKQQAAWGMLFSHALVSAGKSKPTKKWLTEAEIRIKVLTRPRFSEQLATWLNAFKPDPEQPDLSLDIVKGLMWMVSLLRDDALTLALGRATETSYKKIVNIGARSRKHGNAGVLALSLMDGDPMAVAELVRLKTQIKYPSIRDEIHQKLIVAAKQLGVSVIELEENSLPDFGLEKTGQSSIVLGDITATIGLSDEDAYLIWMTADGKSRKGVPASVKRDFAADLKVLKQRVKDITAARKTQIKRLEESWVEGREWSIADWQLRFLDHPLRRKISANLIWRLQREASHTDIMFDGDQLRTIDGTLVKLEDAETVKLWHPLDAVPDEVLAWRRKILAAQITQPIKQAHREVYVLTDAERNTDVYSNRFAAHILRQHQFRALCHARGWTFEFLGGWDNWNVPTKQISTHGISVEYHVDAVENDERSEAYIPLHLSTDQVRFVDADGAQMRLETVPPIIFSELLRDVDLFVAVTSVANDPEWVDGGPEGRHGGYWTHYAFGDLSQTAQTRRDLLHDLVPKLAMSDKLRVTDKFLEVDGTRHSYRIHLGSSNIQIIPSNRYLCIVRGHSSKTDVKVKLPFAGDTMLAIILSKAFLLADDDKITDPTILSQLR